MPERSSSSAIGRRAFAERLALAAAAPFILDDLLGDLELPRPEPLERVRQDQEPSALAKALAEGIRVRYSDRLSADDLQTITQGIDSRLRGLERLYGVGLSNGDEPDFVFSVYRGPDR